MAEDARPPSSRDPAAPPRLTPLPRTPGSVRGTGVHPGAAWWTQPMPTGADAPEGRAGAGQFGPGPADPGQIHPGQADPAQFHPGQADPGNPGNPGNPRSGSGSRSGSRRATPTPTGGPVRPGGARGGDVRTGLRQVFLADGRRRAWTILGLLGGAPLLAALAVVGLLPDAPATPAGSTALPSRPAQTAASRASRPPTTPATPASPSATPSRLPGQPADLAPVATDVAAGDLRRAGVKVDGTISSAWGWTDPGRGRSLVASLTEVTSQGDGGSATGVSLRVYYLTGLDRRPTVQRKLRDPSLRCSDDGPVTAGFTPAALAVRDLDDDGASEVMVGWTARCGDSAAPSRVRFALMSGTKVYVLRGTGVVTGRAAGTVPTGNPAATGPAATDPAATDPASTDPAATDPAATDPATTDPGGGATGGDPGATNPWAGGAGGSGTEPAPVPAASQWPEVFLRTSLSAFRTVYF